MEEIVVRNWQPQDIPDLREVFCAAFGDPPEIADAFHRVFLNAAGACMLAAVPAEGRPEGRPVAAAYRLPGPELRTAEKCVPSAYLYAFGCLPEWREKGITRKVYTALFEDVHREGIAGCLIPATGQLLAAYQRTGTGFVPLGRIRCARIGREMAREASPLPAEKLSREEYARRREEWLATWPHAEYPESYYRLMEEYGYAFLSLPGALAAVIPAEGLCIVCELLCREADPAQAAAGIAEACPASEYEVRTPVFMPGPGEIRPFVYCQDAADELTGAEAFWYPFGLE